MDGVADYTAMRVEVPQRRSSVQQVEDGMRYALPPRRNRFAMFAIPVWLAFWAWGAGIAIRSLGNGPDNWFLLFWLSFWLFGGLTALYSWLGQVVGRELITFSIGTLKIKRSVLGVEPVREYDTTRIQNLRLSREPSDTPARRLGPFNYGRIAFDYGAKTLRFGAGIGAVEASELLEELKSRYGFGESPR